MMYNQFFRNWKLFYYLSAKYNWKEWADFFFFLLLKTVFFLLCCYKKRKTNENRESLQKQQIFLLGVAKRSIKCQFDFQKKAELRGKEYVRFILLYDVTMKESLLTVGVWQFRNVRASDITILIIFHMYENFCCDDETYFPFQFPSGDAKLRLERETMHGCSKDWAVFQYMREALPLVCEIVLRHPQSGLLRIISGGFSVTQTHSVLWIMYETNR